MLKFLGIPVDQHTHRIAIYVKAKPGTDDAQAGSVQLALEHDLSSRNVIHWNFYFHEGVLISSSRDYIKRRQGKDLSGAGNLRTSRGKEGNGNLNGWMPMKILLESAGKEGKGVFKRRQGGQGQSLGAAMFIELEQSPSTRRRCHSEKSQEHSETSQGGLLVPLVCDARESAGLYAAARCKCLRHMAKMHIASTFC